MQESNAKVMVLTKRVGDLQDAMGLMSNDGSRINSKALGRAVLWRCLHIEGFFHFICNEKDGLYYTE